MALLHPLSSHTPLAEFELFAVPPTQASVERDIVTEHRPLSTVSAVQPLEFLISSAQDEYINLRELVLYLKLHLEVSKSDNSAVIDGDWDKIYPVENMLHALFEQVLVTVGDNQVHSSCNTYPYRAYLDTMLNMTDKARRTYLTAGGKLTEAERKKLVKTTESSADKKGRGRTFDLAGRLHIDLAFQERAILGGTTLKLKLVPNRKEFYLMVKDAKLNVNVVLEEAFLSVHRSKVTDLIVSAHAQALKVAPAKYPINRTEVKQISIPKGSLDAFVDNAIVGQLPRRIYIGMVSNDAVNGDFGKNPFHFGHYDTNFIACYYNSLQYPSRAYKPDFAKDLYSREYMGLFEASNQIYGDANIDITRDNYKNGNTLFAFNFAPDLSEDCNTSGYTSVIKRGNLRIEVHFGKQLPEAITLQIYAEYDGLVEITQDRNGFIEL